MYINYPALAVEVVQWMGVFPFCGWPGFNPCYPIESQKLARSDLSTDPGVTPDLAGCGQTNKNRNKKPKNKKRNYPASRIAQW